MYRPLLAAAAVLGLWSVPAQAVPTLALTFDLQFQGWEWRSLSQPGVRHGDPFYDTVTVSFPFSQASGGCFNFSYGSGMCLGTSAFNSGSTVTSNIGGGLLASDYAAILAELGLTGQPTSTYRTNYTNIAKENYSLWEPLRPFAINFQDYNETGAYYSVLGGQYRTSARTWLYDYSRNATGDTNPFTLADVPGLILAIDRTEGLANPWRFDFEARADFYPSGGGAPQLQVDIDYQAFGRLRTLTLDGAVLYDAATAVPEPQTYALMLAGFALLGFIARRRKVHG